MNRTQKGISLIELLLVLLIVGILEVVTISMLSIQRDQSLLRKVQNTHPEAVEFVRASRDAAAHYVVTVKNKDGSESTYTLPRK
jgi:type II secretory pathway pseudopilin PulG